MNSYTETDFEQEMDKVQEGENGDSPARFQTQKVSGEDYKDTEKKAALARKGMTAVGMIMAAGLTLAAKTAGPIIIKAVKKKLEQ